MPPPENKPWSGYVFPSSFTIYRENTMKKTRNLVFLTQEGKCKVSTMIFAIGLGLIILGIPQSAIHASGGYGGGGIQQDKGKIDKEKYQLGKAIYNREIKIDTEVDEAKKFPQYERLTRIQTKLPRPEQRRTNLLDYAGRLTEEQLEALQHFVGVRFNVRLEK